MKQSGMQSIWLHSQAKVKMQIEETQEIKNLKEKVTFKTEDLEQEWDKAEETKETVMKKLPSKIRAPRLESPGYACGI